MTDTTRSGKRNRTSVCFNDQVFDKIDEEARRLNISFSAAVNVLFDKYVLKKNPVKK